MRSENAILLKLKNVNIEPTKKYRKGIYGRLNFLYAGVETQCNVFLLITACHLHFYLIVLIRSWFQLYEIEKRS